MHFIIDYNKKIIFGWSAKCGCSHVKRMYWFLQTGNQEHAIHIRKEYYNELPNDIENYTTILFIRNPYKRLVSGFLDKYNKKGTFRHKWKKQTLTFSEFVDNVVKCNWVEIEKHHFVPQTSEYFNEKIHFSKELKVFNISDIDYSFIEGLYNVKIPKRVLNFKGGHERKIYEKTFEEPVYELDIDQYATCNVQVKQFFNEKIRLKVFNFYENDFSFLRKHGFNFEIEHM